MITALEGGFVLARTRRDADLLPGIGREMQKVVGIATSAPSAVTEA